MAVPVTLKDIQWKLIKIDESKIIIAIIIIIILIIIIMKTIKTK